MEFRKPFARCALALALALLLTGCGGGTAQTGPTAEPSAPVPTATPEPAATPEPTPEPTPAPSPEPTGDGYVHVRSAQELLDAIQPGARIWIEEGYYNVGAYAYELRCEAIFNGWGELHPYVELPDVFDGVEILVRDVEGLEIRGATDDPADTQLVTDACYADVFCFENCRDITLRGLTLGHTEQGDCSGAVLSFDHCDEVRASHMDLFGCGIYAVEAKNGTSDLLVDDSTLRDCSYGSISIEGCAGELTFQNCVMTGSSWGGFYDGNEGSTLRFLGCTFGEQESNAWYFQEGEDVVIEDAHWSEITQYPDYSGMEEP